jgi:hypothetical protein
MTTIAVFVMGEMGSGIDGRLVEKGARVLTSLEGRSVARLSRAKAAGVEILGDADMIAPGGRKTTGYIRNHITGHSEVRT